MLRRIVFALSILILCSAKALAQNCGALPYTLTNGQPADATQVMANFNYAITCADVNRRNLLLNTAALSKLNGAYVRNINTFADGYKATDGVNAGSSTNYTVNTTAGYVAPSTTNTANFAYTFAADNGAGGPATFRAVIDSAQITYGTGSTFTITLEAPSNASLTLDSTYVCILSGSYGCTAAPVQVKFGGSNSVTVSSGQSTASDTFILSGFGTGMSIVVAMYQTSNNQRTTAVVGNNKVWVKYASDAGNQNPTGYTDTTFGQAPVNVKAMTQINSNNMTLVTTAQSVETTITNNRVLLEYNPIDAISLNTDLAVDVTCDGGTNWTTATLAAAGTAQAGRKVAETADTACGTSGVSFAARIKTLTNKSVQIFKATVTVH